MPRYYCDYCDTYLTHDSAVVRKQHNSGYKHKANVRNYYMQFEEAQSQNLIDSKIKEYEEQQRMMGAPGALPLGPRPPLPLPGQFPGGVFPPRPGMMYPPPGSAPPGYRPPPGGAPPGQYGGPYGPPSGGAFPPQGSYPPPNHFAPRPGQGPPAGFGQPPPSLGGPPPANNGLAGPPGLGP